MGSSPGPHSTSLSLTSHQCSGLSPLALQDVQVRTEKKWCLQKQGSPPPMSGSPTLSLDPYSSHTCLSLSQTPSSPVAQTCGKRRWEFHWGNLFNSHNPASARILSLSLNLPRFVIPLLSPSICAGGLGRHPAPSCRCRHCPVGCGRAAWQGDLGKSPLPVPQFPHL